MILLRRLAILLAVATVGFLALSFYESRVLGLFPLGEVPPKADFYHLARSALALLFSLLLVGTVCRHRAPGCPLDRRSMPPSGIRAAAAVLAFAIACTLLFLADPARFGAGAMEDSAIEWLSALLLLGGSALFGALFLRRRGEGIAALPALALAAILFAIGMEEISWFQRVIGFDTPPELARANMQQEFNLHNLHTDLSENLYYLGAWAGLILLPFLRDALPPARAGWSWLLDYVPSRSVLAVSAPLSLFNYGLWNVIPMQVTMMLTLLVAICCSRGAGRRGAGAEAALFAAVAAAVAAGQAAFLAAGHLMPNIWDASEYKELFIAVGLCAWAVDSALLRRPAAACQASRSRSTERGAASTSS